MGNCISINNSCIPSNKIDASIETELSALPSATTTTIKPSIDKLNDDDLKEILVRLSLKCLHRCKCVSKRWLALILNPYFVRQYKQVLCLNSAPYQDYFIVSSLSSACWFELQRFTPLMHSKQEISVDVGPILHRVGLCHTNILAFSHELLFCKKRLGKKLLYVVCNPLTKQWLRLRPFYLRKNEDINYEGIMCYSSDSLSHQVQFIVVIVENKKISNRTFFRTNIFSSETGRWTKFVVGCPSGLRWLQLAPLVVCNGMFHWHAGSCIVAYDPLKQPRKCKIIKLPDDSSNLTDAIGVSEGRIRMKFSSSSNGEIFKFWELADYEKGVWCLKSHVEAPTKFVECIFSPSHGEIVYFTKSSNPYSNVIMFNMKLGSAVETTLKSPIRPLPAIAAQQFDTTQWPTPIPQPSRQGPTSQLLFCG